MDQTACVENASDSNNRATTHPCKCAVHAEENALLFCADCNEHQLACLRCLVPSGEHSYHRMTSVDDGYANLIKEINSSGQIVQDACKRAKDYNSERQKYVESLNGEVIARITELDETLTGVIRELEKVRLDFYTAMLQAAQSARMRTMMRATDYKKTVRMATLQLQKMEVLLQRSVSHVVESKTSLIDRNLQLCRSLENLSWKNPTSPFNLPVDSTLLKQSIALREQVSAMRANSYSRFEIKNNVREIVVVAGGSGKSPNNTSVEVYDAETSRWASAAPMAVGRYWTAAAVWNNKVVVAGGRNAMDEAIRSAEQYDPETNSWSAFPSLLYGRNGHSLVTLRASLYAISGWDVKSFLNSAERYNAQTRHWELAPPLITPRYGFSSAVFESKIMVAGGSSDTLHCSCEVFDVDHNMWTVVASLNLPRVWAAAGTHNNVVYVFGGRDSANRVLDLVETFDNASNKWTLLPLRLSVARWGLSAASLNGYIYLVGGRNDGSKNLVECFDADKLQILSKLPASQARVGSAIASVSVSAFGIQRLFDYDKYTS